MNKKHLQIIEDQVKVKVAERAISRVNDMIDDPGFFVTLAAIFAGVFYFWYYFWGDGWRVLTGG